jgi:hypothetical protein
VSTASANVEGYSIELSPDVAGSTYIGTLTVPESSADLFRAIVAPTLTVTGKNGEALHESIEWVHPKIVSPSPWQKYTNAKSWFSGFISVFSVSSWVFLTFLLFFAGALTLSLILEVKKLHWHVLPKASLLIALLFVLWRF